MAESESGSNRIKIMVIVGILIIVASISIEWLMGWGYFDFLIPPEVTIPSGMILGLGILAGAMLICCTATMMTSSYAAKMPEYGEMEIEFREAKRLFDEDEIEQALELFKRLMGPEMNHKRALYYAARCSEKLDDYENVKLYCQYYIKMQPRDAEVWEMLSNAHKKLFEYEEAEDALERAQKLR